jgi:hypothetical protein
MDDIYDDFDIDLNGDPWGLIGELPDEPLDLDGLELEDEEEDE